MSPPWRTRTKNKRQTTILSAPHLPFHDDGRPARGGGSEGGYGGIQLLLADVAPGSGEVAENRDGNVPAVVGRRRGGGHGCCGGWERASGEQGEEEGGGSEDMHRRPLICGETQEGK